MRTLDIIEIDMVAGGTRASIGAHPLSSSIHHAKAHKKAHHAKAKTHHHHHAAMHKAVAMQTVAEFDAPIEAEGRWQRRWRGRRWRRQQRQTGHIRIGQRHHGDLHRGRWHNA